MFRSNKRHKSHNIEYYDPLADQQSRVHSDYGPNYRGARHQTVTVDVGASNQLHSATPTESDPGASDWSRARYDAPAFVEADVELEEMEDCELEALGLSRYLRQEKASDLSKRMTQSVRSFCVHAIGC